jgi:hypothetical protein
MPLEVIEVNAIVDCDGCTNRLDVTGTNLLECEQAAIDRQWVRRTKPRFDGIGWFCPACNTRLFSGGQR